MQDFDKLFDDIFKRSTIGFDTLFESIDNLGKLKNTSYPPYDIIRSPRAPDTTEIHIALAGYGKDDIDIIESDGVLKISPKPADAEEKQDKVWIHKGIAMRSFELKFTLARNQSVDGAEFVNGMLIVRIVAKNEHDSRNIPIS